MRETMNRLTARIEQRLADERAKKDIRCPACGHVWDPSDIGDYVTCWGEDPAEKSECPECETVLWIKEEVTRTFEVTLIDPDEAT